MPKTTLLVISGAVLAFVAGCAVTAQQRARQIEPLLSAAGFHMHPADSPGRSAALQALTPYKIHYYVRAGKPHYWYADPEVCQCVFAGDEKAYQRYQRLKLAEQMTQEQAETAQLNEDTAMQEEMDLSAWPYDPMW